jgi:hypothetical protein
MQAHKGRSTVCLERCRTVLTGCVERIRGGELKIPEHTEFLGGSFINTVISEVHSHGC